MGFLGLGDGKLELQLGNISVSPGQTLEGNAVLTLNKDVQGKAIVAVLYAVKFEQVGGEMQYGRVSGSRSSLHEVTIYKSEQNLDTEKLYPKVNSPFKYSFSFVIPQDAIQLLCNH